jgi:opacity protein-like surface antigen
LRKLGAALALASLLAASALAQPAGRPRKYEFSLTLGLSIPGGADPSLYKDAWTQELLSSVIDENAFAPASSGAFSCQGFAAYFLGERLGVQLGLGIYSASVPDTSTFNFTYTWKGGATVSTSRTWDGTGRLKSVPLSLNVLYEWRQPKWEAYVSAGPTLFFNGFEALSTAGFGVSDVAKVLVFVPPNWVETVIQKVDALPVSVSVPAQSWVGFGFDLGGGVDYRLSDKWALTADVRYFSCPAKELTWAWAPGTYSGILGELPGWPFTEVNADYAADKTTALAVHASSLRFALGVKMCL